MNKKRIVVIGGSGFIGGSLTKQLINQGYENITVIDHNSSKCNEVESIIGDFLDTKILSEVIKKGDIVIHSACSTVPATSEKERVRDIEENILGTIRLMNICVEKGVNKLIFISSGGTVYGDQGKKPLRETDESNPINSHGVMKLAIEKYLQIYYRLYKMQYVVARIANPYGRLSSGKKKQGLIDIIQQKIINNEEIEIWGNGKVVRDYIFIEDVTNFLEKVIEKKDTTGVFNVGTGVGTSINEILDIMKKVIGKEIRVKYLKERIFDVPYSILNIDKAKREFGWKPQYNIEKGIEKIYKEIISKKNKWEK